MVTLVQSELMEYDFSPEEDLAARILPVLTVLRLKSMKAELIKAKSSIKIDPSEFAKYLQEEAALSGQIDILSQLIIDSENAVQERQAS